MVDEQARLIERAGAGGGAGAVPGSSGGAAGAGPASLGAGDSSGRGAPRISGATTFASRRCGCGAGLMLSRSPRMSKRKTAATPMPAASTPAMNPNRNLLSARRAFVGSGRYGLLRLGCRLGQCSHRFLEAWKLRFLALLGRRAEVPERLGLRHGGGSDLVWGFLVGSGCGARLKSGWMKSGFNFVMDRKRPRSTPTCGQVGAHYRICLSRRTR